MEKETPGQIHGITYKSDGKSSSSSDHEDLSKKTQRPPNEDFSYDSNDYENTQEFKAKKAASSRYFKMGFFVVLAIFFLSQASDQNDKFLARERERAFNEQEMLRQRERERSASPFDEA
jgi:hypothetical protein